MFSVQMFLWHGVRPLVKKSLKQLCLTTGLAFTTNVHQDYSKENENEAAHTKAFHQNWLNRQKSLQESVSRKDGQWVKEMFAKATPEQLENQGQLSHNYRKNLFSALPNAFSNIKVFLEFKSPGQSRYWKNGSLFSPESQASNNSSGHPANTIQHPNNGIDLRFDDNFISQIKTHLPKIATEVYSKEDALQLIETHSQTPFVLSMAKFREVFGAQWPPRASFEDWPEEWTPYKEMAEDMSFKLRDVPTPGHCREWMLQECCKINIILVKQQLEEKWEMSAHSSAVYGLMGALAKLLFAFRWGKLPATQEELDRKSLVFPPEFMEVFEMISNHYGTMPRGSMFSTSFANAVYENDKDGPKDVRFFFTTEEDMRQTETNFFNSFAHCDEKFGKALPDMNRYMALTDFARKGGKDMAKLLQEQRVTCLNNISHHVREMFKTFRHYINEQKVQRKYWAPYIQAATAWNINGMTEGMSGAEIFAFNILDTFLGIKGDSPVYQASLKKLYTIPEVCRELILSVTDDEPDRFSSFLDDDVQNDPILKVKEEILGSLYAWRLGHTKVPARYFDKNNKTTSGGVVDNLGDDSSSLVEVTERQLRQRAMETKACMAKNCRSDRGLA